jgi:hypothetical protein
MCRVDLVLSLNSTEDIMCFERRSLTSDEQQKVSTIPETSKRQDRKQDEVVNNLLRKAREAGQKAGATPAKEYAPAK